MAYYQNDFLITLAYLMGESSVNSSVSASRLDFVQETIKEVYKSYPWRFARSTATLAISNGIATLPTNYDDNHKSRIKFNNGGEVKLDTISNMDSDQIVDGDRAAWITVGYDGETYLLNTKDSDVSSVAFIYQTKAPTINATVGTPYPNKKTIALGARRYVKLGQNPDADISQDQDIFQTELDKDIAAHQVNEPRTRRRFAQGQAGTYTGEF